MKNILLLFFALIPVLCNSQSLGYDRIEGLNKSIVRVLIDSIPSGTGFFVHNDGWVATCHHVIEPAYIRDSLTNQIIGLKNIQIEFQNGEIVEMGIMTYLLNDGYKKSFSYDYSLLKVQSKPKTIYKALKIGKWSDVIDGDEIYSCGYPLGIKQRFISKGILSTKWTDSIPLFKDTVLFEKVYRDVAWLDLTMNKGNSGGAIIKIGKTPEEDTVIGIATFILNPFAKDAGALASYLLSDNRKFDMIMGGISSNKINAMYANAIANNSIGVSGCISIGYVAEILQLMNRNGK